MLAQEWGYVCRPRSIIAFGLVDPSSPQANPIRREYSVGNAGGNLSFGSDWVGCKELLECYLEEMFEI